MRSLVVTGLILGLLAFESCEASNTSNTSNTSNSTNSSDKIRITLTDSPGNSTAGNSTAGNRTNGTAAGPSVEEIKFKNCAFHPDTFEADKTPRDVLVRCYTKMRWESIDLLLDNERLIRRFDYFNNKYRKVKREHNQLLVEYDLTTEKLLNGRKLLREERLDYKALLVALKIEYHELTSRVALHTRFGTVGRTFLTQEEILRENALAQKSNNTQEQDLAMRTAVEAHAEALDQKKLESKAPMVSPALAASRRLLAQGEVQQLEVVNLGGAEEPAAAIGEPAAADEEPEEDAEEKEAEEKEQALATTQAANMSAPDPAVPDDQEEPYMSFNNDNLPPATNLPPYKGEWVNATNEVPPLMNIEAVTGAEFKASNVATTALTSAVEEGVPAKEIMKVVPLKVAEEVEVQKVIIEDKLEGALKTSEELQANATAAADACVQAEELAKSNPSNDEFAQQARDACATAQEFADAVLTSQTMLASLQLEVKQAQQAAITATAMAEEAQALSNSASVQIDEAAAEEEKAAKEVAAKAQSQLEELIAQQGPLEAQLVEAKQAVIDCGEASVPEAVADLNNKRERVENLEKKLVLLMEKSAAAQFAVEEAQTKLGGEEANRAKVLGQLAVSSQQEEKLSNELKAEEENVELAKKEVAAKAAAEKTLMIQMRGAKMAMENAKVDHADRQSEASASELETATEEYKRGKALAEASGIDLAKVQEQEAKDLATMQKSREAKAAATAMRERLTKAAKPKTKGPDPASAAALAEQAEAEKANSAIAKAAAAAAKKAAAKSMARAAAAAAEAAAFAKAEADAAAEANAKKERLRAMMALDDPNKMNPMVLEAKMEGAVKEHSGLTDANTMFTKRDEEVKQNFMSVDADYKVTSHKYVQLTMDNDETWIRLKGEIRKTSNLKPAIGGEGMCMSCEVQLPEPGAEPPTVSLNASTFELRY